MDIAGYLEKHVEVLNRVKEDHASTILELADVIVASLQAGGKLLVMGNGGSAADAQHFAAELVGRFRKERKAIPAIALTTDSSILTAVGNDYGFEMVYARQVEALAAPGDVICGISTSGRSPNVLQAVEAGRQRGCATVCLAGCDGGPLAAATDVGLVVPSEETPHIQEAHVTVIHMLCAMIESRLTCQEG
ncbi:MAG: phosphoheptose isomerase [Desulfuromonas sp.]|nr:MAG: phosphoheptose isomerase [Desulfuromonas sp.]